MQEIFWRDAQIKIRNKCFTVFQLLMIYILRKRSLTQALVNPLINAMVLMYTGTKVVETRLASLWREV